jgi:hypothetical protein
VRQAAALRAAPGAGQDATPSPRATPVRRRALYLASARRDNGTVVTFDHAGRTVEQFYPTTEAKGADTAYDPLKQIVEVKDDQGNLTKVAYDHLGKGDGGIKL